MKLPLAADVPLLGEFSETKVDLRPDSPRWVSTIDGLAALRQMKADGISFTPNDSLSAITSRIYTYWTTLVRRGYVVRNRSGLWQWKVFWS